MGKGSAPKAPDPYQTALMQNKLNMSSAGLGQIMSMVDQVGPDGSLTYTQSGYRDYFDPFSGKTIKVPNYTQTTKLSDAQQQIKDRDDAAQANLAGLLQKLTGQFDGILDKPFTLDNAEVENAIVDRYGARMGDRFKREEASLDAKLAAQGIAPGSAAYDRAMQNLGQDKNDAWNQLFINARDQAVNEALTVRNQPYKEFAALRNGTQIDQPAFGATPGADVATPDYMEAAANKYRGDMEAYKAKQSMLGDLFGGIAGGVAAFAGNPAMPLMFSDRRLKTDIKKVGKTDDGQNIYAYRYKGDKRMHLGLMAQEVERKTPAAVADIGGVKAVDYRKALHLGA